MTQNNRPHPCPPPEPGWFAGRNDETLDVGPMDTKEEAIDEALHAAAFIEDQDENGKCQAYLHAGVYQRVHVDLSQKFDVHEWLERAEDRMEDEEGADIDGERHPLEELTDEDVDALEESVRLAIWHWQHRRGIKLASYWLTACGPGGFEVRPHPDGEEG